MGEHDPPVDPVALDRDQPHPTCQATRDRRDQTCDRQPEQAFALVGTEPRTNRPDLDVALACSRVSGSVSMLTGVAARSCKAFAVQAFLVLLFRAWRTKVPSHS